MEAGGGELTSVVTTAGGFFGFLNPFNWFGNEPKELIAREQPKGGPPKLWLPRWMKRHLQLSARSPRVGGHTPPTSGRRLKGSARGASPSPRRGTKPPLSILAFGPVYRGRFHEDAPPLEPSPRFMSPRFSSLKAQRSIQASAEYLEEQRREETEQALRQLYGLADDEPVAFGPGGQILRQGDGFAQPVPLSEEEAAERAASRAAMEASITEAERQQYRQIFDKFDRDGSGAVSTDEMTMMLRELGIIKSIVEVNQIMIDADPDGSGEIDFSEFIVVMRNQAAGSGGLGDVANAVGSFFSFSWLGGGGSGGGDADGEARGSGR